MPKRAGRTPLPRGEAGRKGEDIRSDLHVTVELRDSGGLQLEVISKVASFYGESIRATSSMRRCRSMTRVLCRSWSPRGSKQPPDAPGPAGQQRLIVRWRQT